MRTTEDPELAERFNRVLTDSVDALEADGIHYVFIGGVASGGLGRPRSTRDIDIFVRPEEAELALRALAKKGFKTENTDPTWLYKGFKEEILVDIIFKSKGDIYLDSEMYARSITASFHGKQLRLVAPEDLILIKAMAHSEATPGHWHDALALLSHATIDWDYLTRRSRRAPRRILSLLLYAQSSDIWIPVHVIDQIYKVIFGNAEPTRQAESNRGVIKPFQLRSTQKLEEYAIARLRERFAEDSRTNELNIHVEVSEGKLLLRGEVLSETRKKSVEQIAHEIFPQYFIENQIRIVQCEEPLETEAIK